MRSFFDAGPESPFLRHDAVSRYQRAPSDSDPLSPPLDGVDVLGWLQELVYFDPWMLHWIAFSSNR